MADSKSSSTLSENFDAVIVGASPAGLSAALSLVRACRKVLIIDDNHPRNAPAEHLHNLVAHDGQKPQEYRAQCRASVAAYAHAKFLDATVSNIERTSAVDQPLLFTITLADGTAVHGRRVVLATGVRDTLPAQPGFKELWGNLVLHCPFCHGIEVKDRDWAFVMNSPMAAVILPVCLPLVGSHRLYSLTDGPAVFSDDLKKQFSANGVVLIETPIAKLVQLAADRVEVHFVDNQHAPIVVGAVFAKTNTRQADIVDKLGLQLKPDGTLVTDTFGKTSMDGVFAGGDNMDFRQQLSVVVGAGATAGIGTTVDLAKEEFTLRAARVNASATK